LRGNEGPVVMIGEAGPYSSGPRAFVRMNLTTDAAVARRWARELAAGRVPADAH
jgi:hypothetical protein